MEHGAVSNLIFFTDYNETKKKKKMTQEATQIEVPYFEATTDGKKLLTPKQ